MYINSIDHIAYLKSYGHFSRLYKNNGSCGGCASLPAQIAKGVTGRYFHFVRQLKSLRAGTPWRNSWAV